ncbi:MAG: IS5 family transposase [Myxococcota bacterium]
MPAVKSSLVHPAYKTEYRVRNWREYEQGLRSRGDVTIWFSEEATASWISRSTGARGGPRLYSDLAIQTSLTLRTVFGLPLRQTEGFVGALLRMLRLDHLPVPDHSTLSRRSQSLDLALKAPQCRGPIHLIVDSTGLQIVGEGSWAAAKHGTRGTRDWRKLHVGVDGRGYIVAHCLTESRVDDASVVGHLLSQISGEVERFTADGAYDKTMVYESLVERGGELVVPPTKNARISKKNTSAARARNEIVEAVRELGRRQWKKQSGYHQQARVENAFYRYKQLIGGRLRSRNIDAQATEVSLGVNVLNKMLELGAPRSERICN